MKKKNISCKTGLKKNVISKKVFDREMELCQMLSRENGGRCGWGRCKDCGAVPLLIKLHKGILLEEKDEIQKAKKKYFRKRKNKDNS